MVTLIGLCSTEFNVTDCRCFENEFVTEIAGWSNTIPLATDCSGQWNLNRINNTFTGLIQANFTKLSLSNQAEFIMVDISWVREGCYRVSENELKLNEF